MVVYKLILDENCKYLRNWDNQLTISEFKKMYDRILKRL